MNLDFVKIRNYLFLSLLVLVTVLFLYIIKPFSYTIFWSAVIAALFYPAYDRLLKHWKRPNLCAALTLVLIILVIIIPLMMIGTLLVRESFATYNHLNEQGQLTGLVKDLNSTLRDRSFLTQFHLNPALVGQKIDEGTQALVTYVFNFISEFTQNSLLLFAYFIVMLFTLFFFIRDGKKILQKLMYLSPLGDNNEIMLYKKFTSTARGALRGTLLVGLIQGVTGAILFYAVGIPAAIIWGLVMTILSIIPATGTFFVWLPAGIILLLRGSIWQGIVVLVVGGGVITVVDNFLRPLIVGKDLQMHPLLILFSTLGGLIIFGVSGFIIGPIVAALFLSFWEMYEQYYHDELSRN